MDIRSIFSKLNFKTTKVSGMKLKSVSPSSVFSVLAIVMIVLDLWLLQSTIIVVIRSGSSDVGARVVQSTRVDFSGYNMAVDRIDGASTYAPVLQVRTNPFQALVKDK